MVCRVQSGSTTTPVRFGFTVARRLARRAVDRNTVKRALREAARQHVAMLDVVAANRSVDIVLRLKRPVGEASPMSRATWKAALRGEADWLLRQLAVRLRAAEAS
jgi:ribonuclease P protein component